MGTIRVLVKVHGQELATLWPSPTFTLGEARSVLCWNKETYVRTNKTVVLTGLFSGKRTATVMSLET